MPHPFDDLPTAPPEESVKSETPEESAPDPVSEPASDSGHAAGPASQDGERRRRRRRRRRRPALPPATEAPLSAAPETSAAEAGPVDEGATTAPGAATSEGESIRPSPRRWLRHRRRPPRQISPRSEPAEGYGQAGNDISAGEAVEGAAPQHSPAAAAPDQQSTEHRPRRRRRRRGASASGPQTGSEAPAGPDAAVEASARDPGAIRNLRIGRPRNRRPRAGEPRQAPPNSDSQRQWRARENGQRATSRREPDRGARSPRDRGAAGRGPRARQAGRGWDAAPKKPEQKLYALEAVVDRGFEDVTDEADENATRRVHWTIVKRTVADQKSGKPMSAVYVLQREGDESQYPNLGAARAAVNKTIIHPEKLTVSKAEHAAERAAAKK